MQDLANCEYYRLSGQLYRIMNAESYSDVVCERYEVGSGFVKRNDYWEVTEYGREISEKEFKDLVMDLRFKR